MTCCVCRKEPAIYKVAGSVLGYRCARIACAKAADRIVVTNGAWFLFQESVNAERQFASRRGRVITPVELFAKVGDELTQVVKNPYRDQPMTDEELDIFSDKFLLMIAKERGLLPSLKEKN